VTTSENFAFATNAARGGRPLEATGPVVAPLDTATTYARATDYSPFEGRIYSRDHNPTVERAEIALNVLEGGQGSLLFASGMAAASAVLHALHPGDRICMPRVMYWSLRNWIVRFAEHWGLGIDLFDADEPGSLERALVAGQSKLLWIEPLLNPTWDVIDIAAAAAAAHDAGARLVVDATAASPALCRPLDHGADIVMHSATKYLNGHSDLLAGALTTGSDDDFWHSIRDYRVNGGAVLGAFEAWLLLRGMQTVHLRVERASQNAQRIAEHFIEHPGLNAVLYPGLMSHPGFDVAKRQMRGGFGGMLSLRVRGGFDAALAVARNVRLFVRATSLGGVESLIEHRASIEGPNSPIPDDLLRLSIGIEDADDLIADLEQALAAMR
jgi:cystathionine gamma-synthase